MTFHILGRVTPADELIFFRGVGIPPTRKNMSMTRRRMARERRAAGSSLVSMETQY